MSREPLRPRAAYRHWTPISTRWHDNDLYGHVNNALYYTWVDTAVNSWLIEVGLLDLAGGDLIGLVVDSGCRYASSLGFPQKIEVGLCLGRLGTSSVVYDLGIFAVGAPEPAAQAHFTHVYVDRASRRPVPLPEHWRRLLATLA